MPSVVLGNDYVSVVNNNDGTSTLAVEYVTGLTLSPDKLVLGGLPLTLYQDTQGGRALAVILTTSGLPTDTLVLQGTTYSLYNNSSTGTYFLSVSGSNASGASNATLVWRGMTLLRTSSTQALRVVSVSPSIIAQESFSVGGMPLTAQQDTAGNWYITIHH